MQIRQSMIGFFLVCFLLGACTAPSGPPAPNPTETNAQRTASPTLAPTGAQITPGTQTPAQPTSPPAATNTPQPEAPTPHPTQDIQREETIMILQPASGSRLVSPVLLEGISDPAFEGTLGVTVVNAEGGVIYQAFANIQAEIGQRGPFSVELPIQVTQDTNLFIQVYMTSARDGGVTHLSSVGVIVSPTGPTDIRIAAPHPEKISILEPVQAAAISGGVLHLTGFGLASFEQTLLIEVLDEDGLVLNSAPVTVQAPDLGQPGLFQVSIPYSVSHSMPGRVVVRDISPAFGGDVHRSSVEVTLTP